MDLINLIFRLGVLFSIYGFLWFFIDLILKMLVGGRTRTIIEVYLIKSIKYLFLVNVTFLFCLDINQQDVTLKNLLPTAIILLMYFIGKFQQKQKQIRLMGSFGNDFLYEGFNIRAEMFLIAASILLFISFLYFPQYASNGVANWFRESIIDLETTVLIGFIFKIIGFFFLIGMIIKMVNGLIYILSGQPFIDIQTSINSGKEKRKSDDFDDFEEVE
ncbi:MAG: hypothetical protein FJZ67_01420 [Bacteroidetes bacterium]|nr:hypothetical protein [Bacteroidota bacterium]